MPARRTPLLVAILAAVAASAMPFRATTVGAATLLTPTIDVTAHRPDHGTASTLEIGTAAHLEVIVRHNGQPVSGNVVITFWDGARCYGLSFGGNPEPLVNGEVDGPSAWSIDPPATGSFQARYLGNATYAAVSSVCVDVVWKAQLARFDSAVHLDGHTVAPDEIAVGTRTHLWSDLGGAYGPIDGTWRSFTFSNGTCSGSGVERFEVWAADHDVVEGMALGGFGGHAFTAPGTYSWQAHFSGGPVYLTRTAACHRLTVKAHPTVTAGIVDVNGYPLAQLVAGSQFYLQATASGAFGTPSGLGQVNVFSLADCAGLAFPEPVTLSDGTVRLGPKTAQSPGPRSMRFSYHGNATYFGAESACINLVVMPPSSTPTVSTPPTSQPTSAPTGPAAGPTTRPSSAASAAPTGPGEAGPGSSGTPASPDPLASADPGSGASAPAGTDGLVTAGPADSGPPAADQSVGASLESGPAAPVVADPGGSLLGLLAIVIVGLAAFLGGALVTARRPPERESAGGRAMRSR